MIIIMLKIYGIHLGQYHNLSVILDTAQIADVFENFRSVYLNEYKLDPCYFVSTLD